MKTFLWSVLLCTCCTCFAQPKKPKPKINYKRTLIFSPLALADLDHTLLLGSEYRFSEKLAVLVDAGYTFASDYISNKHTSGFTVRPAFRLYTGNRTKLFWQAQAVFKQITYRQKDWLGKGCVADVPTYEQYQEFKYRKRVLGFNIITGDVLPLSEKMFLEIFAGLGVRWKRHEVIDQDNSCYRTNTASFGTLYRPKSTSISAPISLRLVYKIN